MNLYFKASYYWLRQSQNIKLRMEIGNMSKKQQPNQRAENSWRPPIGLHRSKTNTPEGWFFNKICTNSVKMDVILNSKTYKNFKKHACTCITSTLFISVVHQSESQHCMTVFPFIFRSMCMWPQILYWWLWRRNR